MLTAPPSTKSAPALFCEVLPMKLLPLRTSVTPAPSVAIAPPQPGVVGTERNIRCVDPRFTYQPDGSAVGRVAVPQSRVRDRELAAIDIEYAELLGSAYRVAIALDGNFARDRRQRRVEVDVLGQSDDIVPASRRAATGRRIRVGGDDLQGERGRAEAAPREPARATLSSTQSRQDRNPRLGAAACRAGQCRGRIADRRCRAPGCHPAVDDDWASRSIRPAGPRHSLVPRTSRPR